MDATTGVKVSTLIQIGTIVESTIPRIASATMTVLIIQSHVTRIAGYRFVAICDAIIASALIIEKSLLFVNKTTALVPFKYVGL